MARARALSFRLTQTGPGSLLGEQPGPVMEHAPEPDSSIMKPAAHASPHTIAHGQRRPLLARMAGWWTREDPLAPADALVVLAGDSAAGGRLQRAVELYRQGWAPRLILSGPPFRSYLNESQLMEREALAAGLPATALVAVAHAAPSTLEEAPVLLEAAAELGACRLLIVSSSFHVPRVRAIYHALAREYGITVRVAAAFDPRFNPDAWWRRRLGIVTLGLELLKYALNWIELRRLPARRSPATSEPAPRQPAGWIHSHRSAR